MSGQHFGTIICGSIDSGVFELIVIRIPTVLGFGCLVGIFVYIALRIYYAVLIYIHIILFYELVLASYNYIMLVRPLP